MRLAIHKIACLLIQVTGIAIPDACVRFSSRWLPYEMCITRLNVHRPRQHSLSTITNEFKKVNLTARPVMRQERDFKELRHDVSRAWELGPLVWRLPCLLCNATVLLYGVTSRNTNWCLRRYYTVALSSLSRFVLRLRLCAYLLNYM